MTSVVQVTNVSPNASEEQILTLFTFLGQVENMALYPSKCDPANAITKVAFVKFSDPTSVNTAQHLTNTVFIDRALMCTSYDEGIIPDENVAMQFSAPANAPKSGLQLPNVDPLKLDEIQRTVYVGNLDSKTATAETLMSFFGQAGDVLFVRMAGDDTQPTRFAFVEFATVQDVKAAIGMSGQVFGGRLIKVNHSNNAIVKPPGKKPDSQEVSEAMRKVREARLLISKALDPNVAASKDSSSSKKRSRSKSRSRSKRRRSRSRDRSSRRRSRSRERSSRRRSRSRERSSRRRSRSRERSSRRRSRSRDRSSRKRSRSRDRSSRRRSRSRDRSRSTRRRSRSRSRDRSSRHRSSRRSRSGSRERRRSKRSRSRSSGERKRSSSKSRKDSKREREGSEDGEGDRKKRRSSKDDDDDGRSKKSKKSDKQADEQDSSASEKEDTGGDEDASTTEPDVNGSLKMNIPRAAVAV